MQFRKMIQSFNYAFIGIKNLFFHENNAKFHLFAAILVIIAGKLLNVTSTEWIFLIFAIGMVFGAEAFNTAIEKLCDMVSPGKNQVIGQVKDLAAAAVLFSALSAAVVGLIIFIPKIILLL